MHVVIYLLDLLAIFQAKTVWWQLAYTWNCEVLSHSWSFNKKKVVHFYYYYMWPDLQKPDIMAHNKIFSIKHYKTLVQKTHFIKYLKWLYKGHNLAILTPISNPRHYCAPYHVRSTKMFGSFSYSNVFIRYERLFTNVQKRQFLSILRQLMPLFL